MGTGVNRSNENLIGQIALEAGYISAEELQECLDLQTNSPAFAPIGGLLVEKGYLTLEELESALRIQRFKFQSMNPDLSKGGLFGQIAVRRGWVSREQLSECLRMQEESTRAGSALRLGQILVEKKYLTVAQFLDVLRLQKKEVAECPQCHTFFDASEASPGTTYVCSSCGKVARTPGATKETA